VLRPYQAVAWAAFFNFMAFAIFRLNVGATVGKGILAPEFVDAHVVFSALAGAIVWDLITWYYRLPTSSSHALIGGMIGAGVAKAGTAPRPPAGGSAVGSPEGCCNCAVTTKRLTRDRAVFTLSTRIEACAVCARTHRKTCHKSKPT
jgi:Phosphate transporter family